MHSLCDFYFFPCLKIVQTVGFKLYMDDFHDVVQLTKQNAVLCMHNWALITHNICVFNFLDPIS